VVRVSEVDVTAAQLPRPEHDRGEGVVDHLDLLSLFAYDTTDAE
jgi:hypothetical protein